MCLVEHKSRTQHALEDFVSKMVTPSRVASVPSTRKGALNDSSVSRSAVSQEDLPDGGFEGWCAVLGS